jgi:hypothetical protein
VEIVFQLFDGILAIVEDRGGEDGISAMGEAFSKVIGCCCTSRCYNRNVHGRRYCFK